MNSGSACATDAAGEDSLKWTAKVAAAAMAITPARIQPAISDRRGGGTGAVADSMAGASRASRASPMSPVRRGAAARRAGQEAYSTVYVTCG